MKQIKNNYKLLNTITMKLKYIIPMLAMVVLIVAGIVLFAGCEEEENKVKEKNYMDIPLEQYLKGT